MNAEGVPSTPRFAPSVLIGAIHKRIVEAEAGRGGVEALCQILGQIYWIPKLLPLRQEIKSKSFEFEAALTRCSKERLQLPKRQRTKSAISFLGCVCSNKCGFKTSLLGRSRLTRCPVCEKAKKKDKKKKSGDLDPLYATVMRRLVDRGLIPTPETVIMEVRYNSLADAYIAGYEAWRLVLDETARMYHWSEFRIQNPQFRNYLDEYRLGRLAGETKIPHEEKQILQFIADGAVAKINQKDAEKIIRLCVEVMKFGYIHEWLQVDEAKFLYDEALGKKELFYNKINEEINAILLMKYGEISKPKIRIPAPSMAGRYVPWFLMPQDAWESGILSRQVDLAPVYKIPVYPKADEGSLNVVFGRVGAGKTFLLSSIFCTCIRDKHELVFTPMGDKSNSFSLASLPLFNYSRNTGNLMQTLEDVVGVQPQGIPVLTLTFLREGEEGTINERAHPPTIYDRVIVVKNARNFQIDFRIILKEMKEISKEYGFKRPVGIIAVRNLGSRFDRAKNENIDVQVATNLLGLFDQWRKTDLSLPARVFIDEVARLARSKISLYAADILRSGETILSFIAESRRNRVSVDLATQMPLEILSSIRDSATNIFFRDLAMSRDKSRSQIDFLLESLQLGDPTIRTVVRDMNNRNILRTGYWYWYHRPDRDIQVIRPSPPTFCLQDSSSKMSNLKVFKEYEKEFGESVLLESWDEVKHLKAKGQARKKGFREYA